MSMQWSIPSLISCMHAATLERKTPFNRKPPTKPGVVWGTLAEGDFGFKKIEAAVGKGNSKLAL